MLRLILQILVTIIHIPLSSPQFVTSDDLTDVIALATAMKQVRYSNNILIKFLSLTTTVVHSGDEEGHGREPQKNAPK